MDALPPIYRDEPSASVSLKVVLGGGDWVVLETAGRRAPLAGRTDVDVFSGFPFKRFLVLPLSRLRDRDGF